MVRKIVHHVYAFVKLFESYLLMYVLVLYSSKKLQVFSLEIDLLFFIKHSNGLFFKCKIRFYAYI